MSFTPSEPTARPFTIPPAIYDWYNAHYNNTTYRAFRTALTESAQYGPLSDHLSNEQAITALMNDLIDASFNRIQACLLYTSDAADE